MPALEPGRETEPATLFRPAQAAEAGLPKGTAERLLMVRERAEDLHRVMPTIEERRELATAKIDASNRLGRLISHPSDGGFGLDPDSDVRVVEQRKLVDKLTADVARIEARYTRTAQASQAALQVRASCEQWLRSRPHGTAVEDAPEPTPALQQNETLLDAIERHRRRVRELHADVHRTRSTCYPSSYCKEKAAREISELAERGRVSVSQLVEFDGSLQWPTRQVQVNVFNTGQAAIGFCEVPDVAMLAFVHRDALLAAVNREIDAESDDQNSLGHAERQLHESVLLADLLAVERVESAAVWAALEQGLPVEHRGGPDGCHAQAILQCRLVTVPPSASGSSPLHQGFEVFRGGGRR